MRLKYLITSLLPISLLLGSTTRTWIVPGSGNWNVPANWSPAGVPNAAGDQVFFSTNSVSPVVTLDIDAIVGSITFDSTSVYQVAGTKTLTLNNPGTDCFITFSPNSTISIPLALVSSAAILQTGAGTLTLGGVISGGGAVKLLTGPVILSAAGNNYSGGTIIQNLCTLQCAIALTLPQAGSVTVDSGGVLDLANNAQTIAALSGAGSVTLGTATLTVATNVASSFSGNISGTGGLTVSGTGSLTLTATNGYSGGTTVSGGSLILGDTNALNSASALTVTTPGIFNLNNFSQNVASLAGTGSIVLGSGTLTISGGSPTVFSGVISGTGPVIYSGTAITVFSGANTYTGGTTISGTGTLQLGRDNALATTGALTMTRGVLNLNNFSQTVGTFSATGGSVTLGSGTLTVAPTANASSSAVISGSGSLVFQGPATWTLGAVQTYTGPTVINGGTLQMGVANGLSSNTSVTVNSPGVLALNDNPLTVRSLAGAGTVSLGSGNLALNTIATTTFSGIIQGTGALAASGTGVQILLGVSTYSGGTTVGATATLEGTTVSLRGPIVNSGTLFFSQDFSGQFGGPLSGAGLLKIGGSGTVTLTGTPSQGSVSVTGGKLAIASGANLTAPTVSIGTIGTLTGSGTVTGSVSNSGIIDPASKLSVVGDVTFFPGSSFTADVAPGASDLLAVSGNVTVQSGSQITVNLTPGLYPVQSRYLIISAGGGPVSGRFQGFGITNPFLEATLLYNKVAPGSVELELLIRSVSDVIQGGNAGAIAKCLSKTNMQHNSDLGALVSSLIFFPVHEVRDILDEMQPSQLRAQTVAEETNALATMQAIELRLSQFDRAKCERNINPLHPWNFWTSLTGNWTDQRHDEHNVGYTAPSVGLSVGFDGKIAKKINFGIAAEYRHAALSWRESQGDCAINRFAGGPYMGYTGRIGYVNAAVLGSIAHFNTTRRIPFFNREAKSKHLGETFLSHADGGFVFYPIPSVSLSPFASVDFVVGWEEEYEERGAGACDFKIDSGSSTLLRSEVGLRIAKCAVRSHGKWINEIKASWVREERFHGRWLNATFREFPCSLELEGLFPSRSFIDLALGLTYLFGQDRFATTLRYDGQFGEGVSIQSGLAQLFIRF